MEFATFPIKIESVKLELYYYFHEIRKLSIINLLTNLRVMNTKLTIFYVERLSSRETNACSP